MQESDCQKENVENKGSHTNNMTIIMVDKALVCGGRQRIVVELSVGLQQMYGRRVVVASGHGPLVKEIKDRGVIHEDIPGVRYGVSHQLRSTLLLSRLIRKYDAKIIHSHCRYHNLSSLLAVKFLRSPAVRVTTAHNVFPDKHWSGFFPEHTICVSPAVQEYVNHVSKAHTQVILNGMPVQKPLRGANEVRRELGINENEVILLNVARLDEQKAQYLLLDAFANLIHKENTPPTRLLIAGNGPLRTRLEKDIDRLRLHNHVMLLGERNDVPDLLTVADIFVLSSKWEGLPVTLIEAACASLPLVTFDVGGVAEIVQDKKTGLLIERADVPGLTAALSELVANRSRREMMGNAANALYNAKFSIERCVEETEKYYRKVLK